MVAWYVKWAAVAGHAWLIDEIGSFARTFNQSSYPGRRSCKAISKGSVWIANGIITGCGAKQK